MTHNHNNLYSWLSISFLMGFLAINPFIGLAKWTDVSLDPFDKIVHNSLLMMPSMQTDRAEFTNLCQRPI